MRSWPAPAADQAGLVCVRHDYDRSHPDEADLDALASELLRPGEKIAWRALRGPFKRRRDRLYGTAAAKEAVRRLVRERHDMDIGCLDLEIQRDQYGCPRAAG